MTFPSKIDLMVASLASQLSARMAMSLNSILEVRPSQRDLFTLGPEGVWVYKVECRWWMKFIDGTERWGDWSLVSSSLVKSWYSRCSDAEKALDRYRLRRGHWSPRPYEYRVQAHWFEERPFRRDLDRSPNLNRKPKST